VELTCRAKLEVTCRQGYADVAIASHRPISKEGGDTRFVGWVARSASGDVFRIIRNARLCA
jgi:hypothetical protein